MGRKLISKNRKATFDYEIIEKYEAGIVLKGSEIKSIRTGQISLVDSFCSFKDGELWIQKFYIKQYDPGGIYYNHDPMRIKKLLMHKHEIIRLYSKIKEKGLTLIPLAIFLKNNHAKVDIAMVRGKKNYDKRRDIAKKDSEREMRREMKGRF